MSKSLQDGLDERPGDPRQEGTIDPERLLDLFGDEDARRILLAADEPKTVAEIVAELDLAQSTAYRKVGELEEAGLLRQVNPYATGNTPTQYRRTARQFSVELTCDLRIERGDEPG